MTLQDSASIVGVSLDSYANRFNMMLDTSVQPLITSIILAELQKRRNPVVLDIGCGKGIGGRLHLQQEIKAAASEMWGIEPDRTLSPPRDVFDHFFPSTLEEASLPRCSVDVAYAVYVMEHVQQPSAFFAAAYNVLKPNGCLLFLTPNAHAFFGMVSRLLNRARVDEFVIRLLRRGLDIKPDHYPICSRCNTPREVRLATAATGFGPPLFAYFQLDGVQGYFPGPFKPIYNLLLAKRRIFQQPESLDTMVCRLIKP